MKCPRCGTTNGKTNKFCRGCGLRLEEILARQAVLRQAQDDAPDDVALGEELFEVWRLYSQAELDAALAKIDKILQSTPESASAHSILALIHERKADGRFKAGAEDEARELLQLAIEQYERIIDLNPDSAADREKLASLRMRLIGQEPAAQAGGPLSLRAALRAAPKPVLAAFGAFLVLLVVGIIAFPGGKSDRPRPVRRAKPEKLTQVATPGAASAASSETGPSVYTFPAPAPNYADAFPTPPPPVPEPKRVRIPTEPAKLPAIVGANVRIVPESKSTPRKPEPAKPEKEEKPRPGVVEEKPSARPDGDTALARAVELRRQGINAEAIVAAEEAIRLYQADIDAGRNNTSAQRGLENARKIVQLCREAESSEPQ